MASLTLQEVAQTMGVSEMTVRRYIKEGKLKAKMQYNRYFIEQNDVPLTKHFLKGEQLPRLPSQEPSCDCACNITCGCNLGMSPSGKIGIDEANLILRCVYMLFGLKDMLQTIELNDYCNIIIKDFEHIGILKEDFKSEEKVLVALQMYGQQAINIYDKINDMRKKR